MFTPEDSLVFGGNFVHSFNISRQIKISEIEDNTKVNQLFVCFFFYLMLSLLPVWKQTGRMNLKKFPQYQDYVANLSYWGWL